MNFLIIPSLNEPKINAIVRDASKILLNYSPDNYCIIVATGDREKLHNFEYVTNSVEFCSYGDSLERSILNAFSVTKLVNSAPFSKIFVMDADSSHPLDAIPKMFDELENNDMVVGTRFAEGSKFSSSLYRKFVTFAFKTLAKLKGSTLSDPMSGFFAIRRSVLNDMKFKPITWKTALEIELYHKKHDLKIKILEVPITFKERSDGLPKSGSKVAIKLFKDLVMY